MNPDTDLLRLRDNLQQVRERVAAAARKSGRSPDEVRLVGVTKYVSSAVTSQLASAGLLDLGESRPQALWSKAGELTALPVRWHMIGHLQRNKIRRTLPLISLLHSGDGWRLLAAVNQEAAELQRMVPILLEINISGDATKHGFHADEIAAILPQVAQFSNLRVEGLMAMAALEGGTDRARRDFTALRQLRDRLAADAPDTIRLHELSMGMSDDYEVAIEEGSTIVRVGSALFEGIAP